MSDDLEMQPPSSPCYSCREPEPNREALLGYLRQQREWITLGRRSKPAVEGWLKNVVEGESFEGSVGHPPNGKKVVFAMRRNVDVS
ncbi:MAG: hypothetical protein AAFX94_22765, partial [Myxococcota bacterium]